MSGRRAGLGKGLGALLPESEQGSARVIEISIEEIAPNPRQPRTEFQRHDLEELATSISELGILQPVVVRPKDGGGYELLVGERRLRASKIAGLERVPAIVREADDREALEQALVENVQRSDLQPLDEAQAFRNLIDIFELTQDDVAQRVGKSRAHVANTMRLLELPDEVQELLGTGRITAGHARALLQVKDRSRLVDAAREVVDGGLTVRQTEALARSAGSEAPGVSPPKPQTRERERAHPDLEESLADHLGTKVKIEKGRRKGRIVIDFGSQDDLHRIMELLLGY